MLLSSLTLSHPRLKGCASQTETFGPFTTFTNVVRGPDGMIVIRKCKQDTQNMRKTSECRIASTYVVPLCSNPECTHVPITPGNNAVHPDKKWRDAVDLSQRRSHWSDTSMPRDGWLHTVRLATQDAVALRRLLCRVFNEQPLEHLPIAGRPFSLPSPTKAQTFFQPIVPYCLECIHEDSLNCHPRQASSNMNCRDHPIRLGVCFPR